MDCDIRLCADRDYQKRLNLKPTLYTILQILSVTTFEKALISQVLTDTDYMDETVENNKQMQLFNL
uniref:Transposase n=1 Tax=uncultured microorganism TaxID=358574 RepID=F8UHA3_9ZZZZ|nr:hypothetical protein LDC_03596 [uncultured microorganism]